MQEAPKAIQRDTMQLTQDSHVSKKNKLPQTRPVTFCILGKCSTNYDTEEAQLAGLNHTYNEYKDLVNLNSVRRKRLG